MIKRNKKPTKPLTMAQWAVNRRGQHDAHLAPWLHHFAETQYQGAPTAYSHLRDKAKCIYPNYSWICGNHFGK